MSHHQDLFPGNTLFDKIARAVCRAGTLPRKELYEAWEVARQVRRKYRGGRVVDMACGHGLLAHIMLILDNTSETALAVDQCLPDNAEKLSEALMDKWPRLRGRVTFREIRIQDVDVFPDDILVSAHACGTLTDLVLEKAASACTRVAVLPCCHDLGKCSRAGLDGWMDGPLAVDVVRAMRLQSRGYRIVTREIPEEITPKNRLLLGEYKSKPEMETLHDI